MRMSDWSSDVCSSDLLLMDWPQPGFTIGAPGSPLVSTAASGGTALAIKSLTPSYAIREGQFFSSVHGGRRYVHMFTASVVASGTGTVTASIFPPLRTSLSVNDVEIGSASCRERVCQYV